MDNTKKNCSKCHANSGICCDVSNCQYHSGEHTCNAQQIKVGHGFAASSCDTVCDTFKPKNMQ